MRVSHASHLRVSAKCSFRVHQKLGKRSGRDLVHQIQLQLGPRLCHISIVKLEFWRLLQWRSNSWETIERGILRSWSSHFHQERADSWLAAKQLPRQAKPVSVKHEIGCGTAVVQNLLIRVALDSPRYLEYRLIDGRLPLASGATRKGPGKPHSPRYWGKVNSFQ